MNAFAFQVEEEEEEKADSRVHQLFDLVVQEVSDVDAMANRRDYLVRKQRENMNASASMGPELVAKENGELTTVAPDAEPPAPAPAAAPVEPTAAAKDSVLTKQVPPLSAAIRAGLLRWTMEARQRLNMLVQ